MNAGLATNLEFVHICASTDSLPDLHIIDDVQEPHALEIVARVALYTPVFHNIYASVGVAKYRIWICARFALSRCGLSRI